MATRPDRALVVIDVQNEYVTGGLRIEHPDVDRSLAQVGAAMDAAAAHGIPVVVVQQTAPAGSPLFARESHGWQLHPVVAGRPRDLLVEKKLPSALAGTDLRAWLDASGIRTVALCGYMTHNCVASTAIQAVHDGLAVEVLADATGSVPYANAAGAASAEHIHEAFMVVLQSRFAATMATREWIEVLQGRREPRRDSIHGSHLAAVTAAATRIPAAPAAPPARSRTA